jgi:hypothetical protein
VNATEYHAIEALSASGCKTLLRSPALYRWQRDNPTPSTPAMRLGTLTHCLVLEPSEYASRYLVRPAGIDGRTKDGKAALEALRAEAGSRELLDPDDFDTARWMADSALEVLADTGLALSDCERSILWTLAHDDGEVPCKARIDAVVSDGILDLKTTSGDLDDDTLAKTIANYQYHLQAPHYLDAATQDFLPCSRFLFLFVRSAAPFEARIVELDHEALEAGLRLRDQAVAVYADCLASGTWPGPGPGAPAISTISLPAWAMRNS